MQGNSTLAFRPFASAFSLAVCIPVAVHASVYFGYKTTYIRTFKIRRLLVGRVALQEKEYSQIDGVGRA